MENLTAAEMMEVRTMIDIADRRLKKLQELAKQRPELTDKYDMRLALADAAAPLTCAIEGLQ